MIVFFLLLNFVLGQPNSYYLQRQLSLLKPLPTSIQGVHDVENPQASPSPSPSIGPPLSRSPAPVPSPSLSTIPTPAPIPNAGISETDLWNALVNYRTSHNRTPAIREESLCQYARKRVQQHLGRADLDNHSGFQADADSGALFSETGNSFTQLGEVLAYLPNVQTATQVIEWGWDSSPAHREGLLSNDSTHACIVGTSPFFVGILGHQ